MPLDANVPPHKTKPFWYIVALAVLVSVGYPVAAPRHGPLWSDVAPSVATFIMMVCVGWFAVRRAQRGETRSNISRIILVIVAIIFFILALIFKRHP
jgi:peptidoglycan/LPS O-acetylase OafA/YrhL